MKRSLPLAAAVTLSAAALAIPAGPALAAGHGHHHSTQHATKAHTHAGKAQAKLDHQRQGIAHAVAAQVRQIDGLLSLTNTTDQVSDTDRTALLAALQADHDAVTVVQASLADATTRRQLVGDLRQAVLVRSIARQQFAVAASVATVRQDVSTSTASAQDLQTQVDAATTAGQDTTAANAALSDAGQQLATATAEADDAVAQVLAVAPGATRDQLNAAVDAAEADLTAAGTALMTGGQDLLTVQQDIAAWGTVTP
jgi:hypothetical protein